MSINLALGILVSAIGLGFLALTLFRVIQEQRSRVRVGKPPVLEHIASAFFLGVIPMIAGAIFLMAWLNETRAVEPTRPVQAIYAPLR